MIEKVRIRQAFDEMRKTGMSKHNVVVLDQEYA